MNYRIISLVDTICQLMSFFWLFRSHRSVKAGKPLRGFPAPISSCIGGNLVLNNKNKGIVYMKEEKLVITFECKFK